ncbi:MAG TPA: lysine--tRNA ligase [Candidatus Paceibacterota bacterium]
MASLEELKENRLQKISKLREKGINPYPIKSNRDFELSEVIKKFTALEKKKSITIAGRIMAIRVQGGLAFCDLNDGTGVFQGLVKKDETGDEIFDLFTETVDIGDFVELTGSLFVSKRGEKTLLAKKWTMLSKSLLPLPEKWHGLSDVEERFRKRYLDLIASPEVKSRFILRSTIVRELRKLFDKEGFIEVETSILQSIAGGANAMPFKTRHNALDIDMYLRIAQEIDLKKLLVGGLPKIYELGRNFRNEGIDATHNPEFTTIEWYEAYSDAEKQRDFVEKIFRTIVKKVSGKTEFDFDGNIIDVKKKFSVVTYFDLLRRFALLNSPDKASREELSLAASRLGVKVENGDSREKILDSIYKKTCRPKIIQPTFIVDYPSNMLPLAKKKTETGDIVDAFQLVVGGMELVKAFSELNDPIDQRNRFAQQEKDREAGDKEAQATDQTFLDALEHGMPPSGGVGLSIDRTTMLLGNVKNIREVILFPTLRPKKE